MAVSALVTPKLTTVHPAPKPPRRAAVEVSRLAAHRLAEAEGYAFADIAADLDAATAIDVGRLVDRQRDPHVRQCLRLFRLIRQARTLREVHDYAALGEGHASEAIRLDQIKDEHDETADQGITVSVAAGRTFAGIIDALLTGRCGKLHPRHAELTAEGVDLLPCHEDAGHANGCCFLSESEDEAP